jgi:hydroxylamine reductase
VGIASVVPVSVILRMTKKKITKDMTFMELMELDSEAGAKLAERGLFCGGCPMAQFETIENGAAAHGVDVEELLRELNKDGK